MAKTTKKEPKAKEPKVKEPTEQTYPKADLLQSAEFSRIERDFLWAYLPSGNYTIDEAKERLEKTKEGAVK